MFSMTRGLVLVGGKAALIRILRMALCPLFRHLACLVLVVQGVVLVLRPRKRNQIQNLKMKTSLKMLVITPKMISIKN